MLSRVWARGLASVLVATSTACAGLALLDVNAQAKVKKPPCKDQDKQWSTCVVTAPLPGSPPTTSAGPTSPAGAAGQCWYVGRTDNGALGVVVVPAGNVDCTSTQGYGWWSDAHQCWMAAIVPPPPYSEVAAWEGHTTGDVYNCTIPFGGGQTTVWDPRPPIYTETPGQAAAKLVLRMGIEVPPIHMAPRNAPGVMGLVGLPVWMWIQPTATTWGPIDQTLTDGGVTLRLQGHAVNTTWDMGDGSQTITCSTPGTPWHDEGVTVQSPTCGYKGYTQPSTSKANPDGTYTITETATWQVNWVEVGGNNTTGTQTVTVTATRALKVGEAQALITSTS